MRMLFFVCMMCLLAACSHDTKVPKGILPPERMGNILFAVTMAEEFVNGYVARDSSRNKEQELQKEYQKVFLVYEVSREDFEKSYAYYRSQPEIFKVLLDSLDARAQRRRMDLYRSPE
ncbi:MAG: DUF4296 domain-containing protein [Chitinophagaceae bacterium]|nr:DUF4296 domain-containing protein [Chitinophagaceae bacterium]MCW5925870.1 DUF4296 domain-containing protein [Chitinophagaceae bacterium]